MRRLRWKAPSPALIISIIALFAALGGTSYAAATIGTSDIKNGAVTNPKLASSSVGFQKMRFGAIHNENIVNSAVGTSKLNVRFVSASTVVANGAEGVITAICPSGTSPITGGGGFGPVVGTLLQTSQATSTGWQVTGLNYGSGASRTLTAQGTCIAP
jgi:hypothetical protein